MGSEGDSNGGVSYRLRDSRRPSLACQSLFEQFLKCSPGLIGARHLSNERDRRARRETEKRGRRRARVAGERGRGWHKKCTSKADASVKSSRVCGRAGNKKLMVSEGIGRNGGHLSRRTMIKGNRGSRRVGANKT